MWKESEVDLVALLVYLGIGEGFPLRCLITVEMHLKDHLGCAGKINK